MRRVLKGADVREGLFAHDVVLARPVGGIGGYCGSEIVTRLEGMEGGVDCSFATTFAHVLKILMALLSTNTLRLRVVVPGTYSNDAISAPGHVHKEIDAREEQDQKEKK